MAPDPQVAVARAPAFLFYARDFLADARVRKMSPAERGVYVTALAVHWNEGSLPADLTELALELQLPADIVAAAWPRLAPCFIEEGGRLLSVTLERRRVEQDEYRRRAAVGGRKSVATRTTRYGSPNPGANHEADVKQTVKRALHSDCEADREAGASKQNVNTASASALASALADEGRRTLPAAGASGRRPRCTDFDASFADFWQVWPRKIAKQDAIAAWRKLAPDAALVATILAAVRTWASTDDWTKDGGKFVPYPGRWVRGERWLDEVPSSRSAHLTRGLDAWYAHTTGADGEVSP